MDLRSMSMKTIAKFCGFVISLAAVSVFFSACALVASKTDQPASTSHYGSPTVTGNIKSKDITESSGIAASRCQNNVLWTHNDSGDDAFIFAINASGNNLGTWKVPNAQNIDWEDVAAYKDKSGKCYIYIGDIGDNKTKRQVHAVYRFPEPLIAPENANSTRKDPLTTANAEIIRFSYPDYDQDAETLMVNPKTADIYVVTKRVSGPAGVYRLKSVFSNDNVVTAEKIAEISVPAIPNGLLTGGDISPDGRRVIICDYTQAYEFVLPETAANFDDIWKQTPEIVNIGERRQGEGISYNVDGTSIFATSEGRNSPIIEVKHK